jgi:hypothetical protein
MRGSEQSPDTLRDDLTYFTHEIRCHACGGWYRSLPGLKVEVFARGRVRRAPLNGLASEERARRLLEQIVEQHHGETVARSRRLLGETKRNCARLAEAGERLTATLSWSQALASTLRVRWRESHVSCRSRTPRSSPRIKTFAIAEVRTRWLAERRGAPCVSAVQRERHDARVHSEQRVPDATGGLVLAPPRRLGQVAAAARRRA